MPSFDFSSLPFAIRDDIPAAYRAYWARLAAPGGWWTGTQRVAIAAETRGALGCTYCDKRKRALSAYAEGGGEHQATAQGAQSLPANAIDAVHRIVTDQSRITQRWIDGNAEQGLTKNAYVELVGIVVAVFSIDEFHRALGAAVEPLPSAETGEPTQYQPANLNEDTGFVPMVAADGATGNEADLWPANRTANVVRALSLVPDALRDWRSIADVQYLSFANMANFGQQDNRSIDRMQMELIAGRVSAINECFY